jgi:predicted ester cyclase
MSVESNKSVLLQAVENFNDPARRAQYFHLYAEDAVVHGYPGVGPGLASLRKFYHRLWNAFPDLRVRVDHLIGEDDKLAFCSWIQGTHLGDYLGIAATGRKVTSAGVSLLRFSGGRCVERWTQADLLGALLQVRAIRSPKIVALISPAPEK